MVKTKMTEEEDEEEEDLYNRLQLVVVGERVLTSCVPQIVSMRVNIFFLGSCSWSCMTREVCLKPCHIYKRSSHKI